MKVFILVVLLFYVVHSVEVTQLSAKFVEESELIPNFPANLRTGLIDTDYRWPDNIIPYDIADLTTTQSASVREALDEMEAALCLTFVPRTTESNYLQVTNSGSGCTSYTGMRGGAQKLNLESGCYRKGTIMNLFIRSLGFEAMHCAADRDNYVEIIWENIETGKENNFEIADSDKYSQFGVPYDYGSVLHGSTTYHSTNGLPTIVPRDPNAVIGQREGMSLYDIQRIKNMYCP